MADFDGDISLQDPNAYTMVHVGGYFWRARVPGPAALKDVATVADSRSGDQLHAINSFLHAHLHPDDFAIAARRLLTPDDAFSTEDYIDLYRAAVTVGTARPFPQSSASRARRRSRGGSSARGSRSEGSVRRSKR